MNNVSDLITDKQGHRYCPFCGKGLEYVKSRFYSIYHEANHKCDVIQFIIKVNGKRKDFHETLSLSWDKITKP